MADEKRYQEEVATESPLTHHPSAGLHHDHIAEEAIGGHTADLGRSYFTSPSFIGTVIVCTYHVFCIRRALTINRRHA
jgi:hypothetical protein